MSEPHYMEKAGLVTQVKNQGVKITLLDTSGCASCSNSLCMLADAKSRYVEVPDAGNSLKVGDEVLVRVKPAAAYAATFWLYGMPFLLIMITLFGLSASGMEEAVSGSAGLLVLVPYYGGLFLFRRHLHSDCSIDIIKR